MDKGKETTMEAPTREYLLLFNALTDLEKELSGLSRQIRLVQQLAEEVYLGREEPPAS